MRWINLLNFRLDLQDELQNVKKCFLCILLSIVLYIFTKGGVLYLVFCPRTRPKTSLQCFASEQRESKAKNCRDVLGCILGRKNKVQKQSFRLDILTIKMTLNTSTYELTILRGLAGEKVPSDRMIWESGDMTRLSYWISVFQ